MRYKEVTTYSIYELIDPRDRLTRYVGCTLDMEQRYYRHLAGDSSTAKSAWIEELKSLDLIPLVRELEQVQGTIEEAEQREVYWIRRFLNEGKPLLNVRNTVTRPLKQTSFYLDQEHLDKLDDLELAFRNRHQKIYRNDIVRYLIEQCQLDNLLRKLAPEE